MNSLLMLTSDLRKGLITWTGILILKFKYSVLIRQSSPPGMADGRLNIEIGNTKLVDILIKLKKIIFPATFFCFSVIYWGVLFWLAEKADDVLIDAIPYSAASA